MHYYQFNIGDYTKDAKHLTLEEDAIYRRLIDLYYLDEQPIPLELKTISRKILARDKEVIINEVLKEFFIKTEKGYEHSRIKKELKKYKNNIKNKQKAANARWAKDSTDANAMQVHSKRNANQEPITINQQPTTKDQKKERKRFAPPSYKEVLSHCNDQNQSSRFINHYESNGWKVGRNKMVNWKACLTNWMKRQEEYSNEKNQQYNQPTKNQKLQQANSEAIEYLKQLG